MQSQKFGEQDKLENVISQTNKGLLQRIKDATVIRLVSYAAALTLGFGCAAATKQPSVFQTNPGLLTRQYTAEQITAIQKNYEADKLQYSQELGNLLLWQMHQKSPEFALEFAQTPELNRKEGNDKPFINPKEAKAMMPIYNLIKNLDIPPDIFAETHRPPDSHKIIMKWTGNSDAKSDWSGHFYQSPGGKILDAKPIDFEQAEDRIDQKRLAEYEELKWESMSASGDEDGIKITLKYPRGNKIFFDINNQLLLSFTRTDMVVKPFIQFDEKNGLEGTLTITEDLEGKPPTELCALRDMVLAGENDYRYSAPLQALLWGYIDGKFKEADNPLRHYIGLVDFVKPIWGDMEGPRWKDFKEVTSRLNLPELINYYEKENFTYDYYLSGHADMPDSTPNLIFKRKSGNCDAYSTFTTHCLRRAGYKAWVEWVMADGEGHYTSMFKTEKGIYVLDNAYFRHGSSGLKGPFNSVGKALNQFN